MTFDATFQETETYEFRYVGNLSKSTSEYVIKEIFSVIGNVTDVKMITHEVRNCITACRYANYGLGPARFTAILFRYI